MALDVKRVDGAAERQVMIAMVVSDEVAAAVAAKWEYGMMPSDAGNLVASWCVRHVTHYGRAPGKNLRHYFHEWAATKRDPALVEPIEALLASLSGQYAAARDGVTPAVVRDVAAKVFTGHRLRKMTDAVAAALESGDVGKADAAAAAYRRLEMGPGKWITLGQEPDRIEAAFSQAYEQVVEYPGAAGNFFGRSLCRDGFVAFMAPEKRGKSFFLQDLAWRAVEQGRRVAYFECGDHSEPQAIVRLGVRASGRKLVGDPDHPVKVPISIAPPENKGDPEVAYKKLWCRENLTGPDAAAALAAAADRLRVSVHVTSSMSVRDAENELDELARDEWYPDVVVFDYADVLKAIDPRAEKRDQVNDTWKALRAMSQKRHCLVVTATQTNKESYTTALLTREHFSEDHRKLAQVTGMVGINQTEKEIPLNVFRLGWVVRRDLEFDPKRVCYLAHCLAIGNPCVASTF